MRSKRGTSKLDFYFTLLQKLKAGKTTIQISKELNLSKQNIYYYTTELRKLGIIEKRGYGVWEVKTSKRKSLEHALDYKSKKVRGHAFIWKVLTSKNYNWKEILDRRKINYELIRNQIPRIKLKDSKIWLSKKSIIVYENKSFYGKNAIESRKNAMADLLPLLRELEKLLGVSLGKKGIKATREHFGLTKNELAKQCNQMKEKIIVSDNLDGEYLWIDDSDGTLGELETGGKGITQDRTELNRKVQNWYNDHKKYNFEVTPSFLMENINSLAENQKTQNKSIKEFAVAINEHIPVYSGMKNEVTKLRETVEELKNEIKNLKNN